MQVSISPSILDPLVGPLNTLFDITVVFYDRLFSVVITKHVDRRQEHIIKRKGRGLLHMTKKRRRMCGQTREGDSGRWQLEKRKKDGNKVDLRA